MRETPLLPTRRKYAPIGRDPKQGDDDEERRRDRGAALAMFCCLLIGTALILTLVFTLPQKSVAAPLTCPNVTLITNGTLIHTSNTTLLSLLNLTFSNTCVALVGYDAQTYGGKTYVIFSFVNSPANRSIGLLNTTTGVVEPTCLFYTLPRANYTCLNFTSTGVMRLCVENVTVLTFPYSPLITPPPPLQGGAASACNLSQTFVQEVLGDGSEFGRAIEMSGDGTTIAIGARQPSNSYVKVYRWIAANEQWMLVGNVLQKTTFSFTGREYAFAVSLSHNGSLLAVGGLNQTFIYELSNTSCIWQESAIVPAGGFAVSVSANGLTVATSNIDQGALTAEGETYIFDRINATTWIQRGQTIQGDNAFDYSGFDISLYENDRVAIGIIEDTGTGRTKVYQWQSPLWVQLGSTILGQNMSDNSGSSVSLKNNTLAIGAWQNDNNGTDSGNTRVFVWNGVTWNQIGQDLVGETANDYSGTSVSLSLDGKTVAIGALFNPNFSENGQVRIYDYNGSTWIQRGPDIDGTAFSQAGICSMSEDATLLAIGSPRRMGTTGAFKALCIY